MALRTPQQDYLFERKERLKKIQKRELREDGRLFRSIQKPHTKPPWFLSRDVDNNTGGILEQLSSFFSDDSDWSKYIRERSEIHNRKEWFGYDPRREDVSKEDTHEPLPPNAPLLLLRMLKTLVYPDGGNSSRTAYLLILISKIHLEQLFVTVDFARLQLRLVDERNPKMREYPNADGSNLNNDDLKISWLLHRAWIRTLHLRSLNLGPDSYGSNHLYEISLLTVALHKHELERVVITRNLDQRTTETPALYGDILQTIEREARLPSHRTIYLLICQKCLSALVSIAKYLQTETRTNVPNASLEDMMAYNMEPPREDALYDNNTGLISTETSFLAHLVKAYMDLETTMREEHVEDVLMSKRLVIVDDNYTIFDTVLDDDYSLNYVYNQPTDPYKEFKHDERISKISEVNRYRHDYLLLRGWSKKRPWKQIYWIVDRPASEPGLTGIGQCVQDFYETIDGLKELEKGQAFNPSSAANVWENLFPMHPIASHGVEGREKPFRPLYWEGRCVICQEGFEDTPLAWVARLHCDHLFHFSCVRDHWDNDSHYQSRCPTCRSGAVLGGWFLHEVAGIYPEALDLFDNRLLGHDAVRNRAAYRNNPDLGNRLTANQLAIITDPDLDNKEYNDRSNEQYYESAYTHRMGLKLDPAIEMIHVRRIRRILNRNRRKIMRELKRDIRSRYGVNEVNDAPAGLTAKQTQARQDIAERMRRQHAIVDAENAENGEEDEGEVHL